jgi:hypothetical protein
MNSRSAMGAILAVILVGSVLAVYSLQTFDPRTVTTTVFEQGQVKVINATGSQAVLCAATSYFLPDTETVERSTVITAATTTLGSSTYASATNATQSAGYVVTSTSFYGGGSFSNEWTVVTCTYLP